ncbi:D-alanyl-D-alanine dipeptidase [candidate division KSB1 bacterium]|nr:D-alanyl-D-alanine dipeptidase [candidate division KSB1 bacterium]
MKSKFSRRKFSTTKTKTYPGPFGEQPIFHSLPSRLILIVFCLLLFLNISEIAIAAQPDEPLVEVSGLDSTIIIDMRYASEDNFVKVQLYPVARCLLRKSVAERLVRVQKRLQALGYGVKVWDAYRPLSVQKKMWEILPDPRYVAPPERGSRHNRGAAVDVTLVDSLGHDVEMPTEFDDFSRKAAPTYPHVSETAKKNRQILIDAMEAEGFKGISSEWWHYDAPRYRQYPILDEPLDRVETDSGYKIKN